MSETLTLSLRAAYETYKASPTDSKAYRDKVDHALSLWSEWHAERNDSEADGPPVGEIDNAMLLAFRNWLARYVSPKTGRPLAPSSVNTLLRHFLPIFGPLGPADGKHKGALGVLPARPYVEPLPVQEKDVVTISEAEIVAIYEACKVAEWPSAKYSGVDSPAVWWQALFVYLVNCGCRRSDFLKLEPHDVDFDAGTVRYRMSKRARYVTKPLVADVLVHLHRILPDPVPADRVRLFQTPNTPGKLYEQFHAIQDEAGIHVRRPKDSDRKPFYGYHEVRSTCATRLWEVSPKAAQEMLGHRDIKTTERHYKGANKHLVNAAAAVPQLWQTDAPEPDDPPATIPFPRTA